MYINELINGNISNLIVKYINDINFINKDYNYYNLSNIHYNGGGKIYFRKKLINPHFKIGNFFSGYNYFIVFICW